jgi:hypothetical protein
LNNLKINKLSFIKIMADEIEKKEALRVKHMAASDLMNAK